jgi:hypothetical protein
MTIEFHHRSRRFVVLMSLPLFFFTPFATAQIISVAPAQNALNVPPATNISVTFNQAMSATTINDTTFRVWGMQSGLHRGAITYDANLQKATFTPTKPFAPGEIVFIALTKEIKTGSGQPLNKFSWHFTVAVKPSSGRFAAEANYAAGSKPYSVFAFDADGDEDPDLAVTNHYDFASTDSISILKNAGDGTFPVRRSYAVGSEPLYAFAADLDGDGDMDMAVANYESHTVSILKNAGDGTFQQKVDYAVDGWPTAVFAADLDGDGDADLTVTNRASGRISILKNNGNGAFQTRTDYAAGNAPQSIFAADLDGDGDIDLAVANEESSTISIFKNNGDGTFQTKTDFPAGSGPRAIFASDADGDGDADLAVIGFYAVSMLKNKGNGSFQAPITYRKQGFPESIFVADLDGDKDADIAATNAHTVFTMTNNGKAAFQASGEYAPAKGFFYRVFAADLDGDGDADLAVTNREAHIVSILINRGLFLADPVDLNFGAIDVGSHKDLNFSVYNYGAGSINIMQIVTSNADFTITSKTNFMLAAGDGAKVGVRYAPTSAASDTGTISVLAGDYPPEKISVRGSGVPPAAVIAFSPAKLDFGNVTTNKTADLSLNIFNLGSLDLSVTNILNANSNFFVVDGVPLTIPPKETKTIVVRFTPPFLGSQSDTLQIFSNDERNNPVRILLSGNGVAMKLPEVSAQPLQLSFDSVRVQQSKSLTVRVYHRGAANLNISNMASNNTSFAITTTRSFILAPGDSSDVSVKFSPLREGLQTGAISIASNDGNENPFVIRMNGMGMPLGTSVNERLSSIPSTYQLEQNFPNPFNPTTTIRFETPTVSHVKLVIYNLRGELVRALIDSEMAAGFHQVTFDASNLASGIYFYRLEAGGNFTATHKMVLGK